MIAPGSEATEVFVDGHWYRTDVDGYELWCLDSDGAGWARSELERIARKSTGGWQRVDGPGWARGRVGPFLTKHAVRVAVIAWLERAKAELEVVADNMTSEGRPELLINGGPRGLVASVDGKAARCSGLSEGDQTQMCASAYVLVSWLLDQGYRPAGDGKRWQNEAKGIGAVSFRHALLGELAG